MGFFKDLFSGKSKDKNYTTPWKRMFPYILGESVPDWITEKPQLSTSWMNDNYLRSIGAPGSWAQPSQPMWSNDPRLTGANTFTPDVSDVDQMAATMITPGNSKSDGLKVSQMNQKTPKDALLNFLGNAGDHGLIPAALKSWRSMSPANYAELYNLHGGYMQPFGSAPDNSSESTPEDVTQNQSPQGMTMEEALRLYGPGALRGPYYWDEALGAP